MGIPVEPHQEFIHLAKSEAGHRRLSEELLNEYWAKSVLPVVATTVVAIQTRRERIINLSDGNPVEFQMMSPARWVPLGKSEGIAS